MDEKELREILGSEFGKIEKRLEGIEESLQIVTNMVTEMIELSQDVNRGLGRRFDSSKAENL